MLGARSFWRLIVGARLWGCFWGATFGVDRGSKVAGVELGVAKSLELKVGAKSLGMSVGCDIGRGVAGLVLGARMC